MLRLHKKWVFIVGICLTACVAAVVYLSIIQSANKKNTLSDQWVVDQPKQASLAAFVPGELELVDIATGKSQRYFGRGYTLPALGLVHYWATWCAPCAEELPRFIALSKKFSQVNFFLISVDETLPEAKTFLFQKLKVQAVPNLVMLFDPTGDSASGWGTQKLPETYLMSPQGVIFDKFIGPKNWNESKYLTYIQGLIGSLSSLKH